MWPQICYPEAPRTPTESCGNSYFPFLRNGVTNVQTLFANQLTDFCEVDNRMCRSDSSYIAASHDPETVFEESNTPSVVTLQTEKKSRSSPQAGKTEKRGWRGGGLQQKKKRKGRDKDMHGKIICRTCSDNVQKPNTGFSVRDDTCTNGGAAAGRSEHRFACVSRTAARPLVAQTHDWCQKNFQWNDRFVPRTKTCNQLQERKANLHFMDDAPRCFFAEGNSELHLDAEGLTHFRYAVLERWSFNSLAWQGSESRRRFTAGLITVAKSAEGLLDELCRLHSWKCSQISINVLWRSASQSSTMHLSAISGTWKSLTLRKSC